MLRVWMVEALSLSLLTTKGVPSLLGIAIVLLYVAVPKSGAQSVMRLRGPIVMYLGKYKESTIAM